MLIIPLIPSFFGTYCLSSPGCKALSIIISFFVFWYYYHYYYYSFSSFLHQPLAIVSHTSLSDSKSPQISRTLLSILADLNNAVVWMVSTRPLISKFSSPCSNPLVTVRRAPIPIGLTVTFMFQRLFFLIP